MDKLTIEHVLDQLPDGMIWIEANGTITGCNQAFLAMANLTGNEDIEGKSVTDVAWAPQNFHILITAAEIEHVIGMEKMLRQETGKADFRETFQKILGQERVWLEFLIIPLLSDASLFVFRNVTEKEKSLSQMRLAILRAQATEAELRETMEETENALANAHQLTAAKADFLSDISHELRTPLHAIRNYALNGLKYMAIDEKEKLGKAFTNIYLSGDRLTRIINNLLDYSKMEAGKMHYHMRQDSLLIALEQAINELQILLDNKQIKLHVENNCENVETTLDRERMIQVFINLLSNAIKYTPQNSTITVTLSDSALEKHEHALQVRISDEGKGIPDGELGSIFQKYEQSSANHTPSGAVQVGTGIGLSICETIISAHLGEIWAENNKEKGASFLFAIPRL